MRAALGPHGAGVKRGGGGRLVEGWGGGVGGELSLVLEADDNGPMAVSRPQHLLHLESGQAGEVEVPQAQDDRGGC